ncbi:serine/threonine-protein kinase [Candidatus Uabimicrobium amorphum]|uniref:Serine/threonine protein kinase n=1 Tax=Uabimicrobium amorphum TaxID=2596890 RepID=A0A5S9F5B3_UABAM|nr:serine/threonine-protein kinase [Candidatus Uabimicrobium amorphum]BBM86131.1 serine/threonine protein kinase [Candidatus Uabimicrobium amorphum]
MNETEFRELWTKTVGDNLSNCEIKKTYKPTDIDKNFSHQTQTFSDGQTYSRKTIVNACDIHDVDYNNIQEINRGGMGIIYKAFQRKLHREVALKKILDARQGKQFVAEALVTAYLDHPNIVPIYQLKKDMNGNIFFAMKLVNGIPWRESIYSKTEDMDLNKNLQILLNVCKAVEYAHSKNIIHCDLKPENVMLGDFNEVLVMDWGIAVSMEENEHAIYKGDINKPLGTPTYMPPELATGSGLDICPATDTYLLGGILYQILHQKPLRNGSNLWSIICQAKEGIFSEIDKSLAPYLQTICKKALHKDISQRYQNVTDFKDDIEMFLRHQESFALVQKARKIDVLSYNKTQATVVARYLPIITAFLSKFLHLWREFTNYRTNTSKSIYENFQKVISLYKNSLRIWDGNKDAYQELQNTYLRYAQTAFDMGDVKLAQLQLKEIDRSVVSPKRLEEKIHQQMALNKRNHGHWFTLALLLLLLPMGINYLPMFVLFFVICYRIEKLIARKIENSAPLRNTVVAAFLTIVMFSITMYSKWNPYWSYLLYFTVMLCYSWLWLPQAKFFQRMQVSMQQTLPYLAWWFMFSLTMTSKFILPAIICCNLFWEKIYFYFLRIPFDHKYAFYRYLLVYFIFSYVRDFILIFSRGITPAAAAFIIMCFVYGFMLCKWYQKKYSISKKKSLLFTIVLFLLHIVSYGSASFLLRYYIDMSYTVLVVISCVWLCKVVLEIEQNILFHCGMLILLLAYFPGWYCVCCYLLLLSIEDFWRSRKAVNHTLL